MQKPENEEESELLGRGGPAYPAVRFMVASDLHHLSPGLWSRGPAFDELMSTNDGKLVAHSSAVLAALERSVAAESPDFLVVTGDLTFNGAAISHRELAETFGRIETAGTPVYVLPGNHDISNPWAARFTGTDSSRVPSVDPEEFREIYADFGYRDAASRDPASLAYSVRLSQERRPERLPAPGRRDIPEGEGSLRLLFLDSNEYSRNQDRGYPEASGSIGPRRERWLVETLQQALHADEPVLTFFHHSLLAHSRNPSFMSPSWIDLWPRYARLFWDHAAPVVFTGHVHNQDVAGLRGEAGEWIYDVATGSFATFPHSYRIVEITPDQRLSMKGGAAPQEFFEEPSQSDLYELSRTSYLRQFMQNFGRRVAAERGLSRQEATGVGAYPALVTLQHNAGEELGARLAEIAPEAHSVWEDQAPAHLSSRIADLSRDLPPRDNDIVIDLLSGQWRSLRSADAGAADSP